MAFMVESGVNGAMRINRRVFHTREEAEACATRVRQSNSIGSYWAEIEEVDQDLVEPRFYRDLRGNRYEDQYGDGRLREVSST